jgi:hypothetical protein
MRRNRIFESTAAGIQAVSTNALLILNYQGTRIGQTTIEQRKTAAKKVSGRWGCRPLVGMGVMEVQTFEVAFDRLPRSHLQDAVGRRRGR